MVRTLIRGLLNLCQKDSRVILLIADDKEVYDSLYKEYPTRVINIGISECNAVSVAAGLASCGNKPYVIGGNSFMAYRAYEFIRDQVCMQNRNVKIIGIGAGLAISYLGNTQHATEDIGALRVLPNLSIMTPAMTSEIDGMLEYSITISEPMFIRIGRTKSGRYYNDIQFIPNKIQEIRTGENLVIISTGNIICEVMEAAELLEKEGIDIGIVNVTTVKPINEDEFVDLSIKYKNWISIEEHNIIGGLGTILSEIIVNNKLDVSLKKIGLNDEFAKGHGTYDDVKSINGLNAEKIITICNRLLCYVNS